MTHVTRLSDEETGVEIQVGGHRLGGSLRVPSKATGMVLFAHGSGSSRFSPRNRFVASELHDRGLATLLMDLLDEREAGDQSCVFDIELLADRLKEAANWLARQEPEIATLPLGLFGASTGAAAALIAAANTPHAFHAVVSRGGRPDLAADYLRQVTAPTLLIVGGHDDVVVNLNQDAFEELRCTKQLIIVPGATHLFEEPGTLDEVGHLAADWFTHYLLPREQQAVLQSE
ncbi:MAG: dienelactone hydrolase family protein [Planctomycetaceae bacterium]